MKARAPDGFSYPRRIEYENNGVRAFVRPALERKTPEVIDEVEALLDEIARFWERA